jgi:hypothetical protein
VQEGAMSSTLLAWCDASAEFLAASPLKPLAVWPARPPVGESAGTPAGFRVGVSAADGSDFDRQVADALQFLRDNRQELIRLAALPGAKMHLFFVAGKPDRDLAPGADVVAWHCSYPAELVRLVAEFGMSLSVKCDPMNLHAELGAAADRPGG